MTDKDPPCTAAEKLHQGKREVKDALVGCVYERIRAMGNHLSTYDTAGSSNEKLEKLQLADQIREGILKCLTNEVMGKDLINTQQCGSNHVRAIQETAERKPNIPKSANDENSLQTAYESLQKTQRQIAKMIEKINAGEDIDLSTFEDRWFKSAMQDLEKLAQQES